MCIYIDVSIHIPYMYIYIYLHIHIHIQSSIDHRSHLVNYTSSAAKLQAKKQIIEDFTRHFLGGIQHDKKAYLIQLI